MLELLTSLNPIVWAIVGVIIILIILIYLVVAFQRIENNALSDRINEYAAREEIASIEDIELSLSFNDRVIVPLMKRLSETVARYAPQAMLEQTQRQLEVSGKTLSASEFWLITIGSFFFFSFIGWYLSGPDNLLLFTLGGAVVGFVMPRYWLTSAINRRKEGIIKKLPDALDLMTICVDAGLTFDGAMTKVKEKWDDPLSNEFGRVVYEMQLGKTRRQSLKDMSLRMDVPDVQSFIASVLQADQLGVSVGKVLRIQSEQMRMRRRQRAEEKAQQAPIKMLFPMVFLIFPSMFIVLLGPAGIRVYRTFF